LKSAFDCFEAIALIYSLHQSISSTTVLQLQQRSLLERIRELNDEIQSISYALNNNNNNGKVPITPQLPCCTEKTDIVGSGVKKSSLESESFLNEFETKLHLFLTPSQLFQSD
jgi:deoxycytidylate deaminase